MDSASLAEPPGRSRSTASSRLSLLGDELQHDRRDEGLGDAADPERSPVRARCRADIGLPRGNDGPAPILLVERDHARDIGRRDEPVGGALELRCRGRGRGGEDGTGESERREVAHVLDTPRAARVLRPGGSTCKTDRWRRTFRSSSSCRGGRPRARWRWSRGPQQAITRRTRRSFGRTSGSPTGWRRRSRAGTPVRQEAVQNAHVKAYRSLRRFRRGAAFRPWLLRSSSTRRTTSRGRTSPRAARCAGSRAATRATTAGAGRGGHRTRGGRGSTARPLPALGHGPPRDRPAVLRRAARRGGRGARGNDDRRVPRADRARRRRLQALLEEADV